MLKIKNLVSGIGIVIVFALALWQGIETFYPSPEYDEFCDAEIPRQLIETLEQCESAGGKWYPPAEFKCETTPCPQGYCDLYFECQKQYEEAQDSHSKVVFFISLIVGIITIIIAACPIISKL